MQTKILTQQKNPFLQREEYLIEIQSNSTPSSDEIKKSINKSQNLIIVKKIKSNFGAHIFNAEVYVYDSEKSKKQIEPKNKNQTQEPPAQKQQETPTQPKKQEEKSEQPKPEQSQKIKQEEKE